MSTINKIKINGVSYDIEDKIVREELANYKSEETDPTVPEIVKSITEGNISAWNGVVEELANGKVLPILSGDVNGWTLSPGVYFTEEDTRFYYKLGWSFAVDKGLLFVFMASEREYVAIRGKRVTFGIFASTSGTSTDTSFDKFLTNKTGATKEYVDTSIETAITSAITDTLGGSY